MSMNSVVSPEVEVELKRQQARATLSSLLISLLAIILVGLILFYIAIKGISFEQPDVVTYKGTSQEKNELEVKKVNSAVQRKPSSPSSSAAKVIASNTVSPTAVPVPEVDVPVPSVEFGDGDDFGAGWGSGGGGGAGGGGTSFFGQKSSAERIAFVIDYSGSMKQNNRVGIMKKELTKSIDQLTPGTEYQMIFFAGPVWVAGSKVQMAPDKKSSSVKGKGGKTFSWVSSGGAHAWKPRGSLQKANWLQVPSAAGKIGNARRSAEEAATNSIKRSKKLVAETELVWGTRWKYALDMALDMRPSPEVIYFMTDGSTGSEAMQVAKTVGAKAKSRGITINTIAMMEPRAHDAMKEMAKRTGGKFTVVEAGGKTKNIPIK